MSQQATSPKKRGANVLGDISQATYKRQKTDNGDRVPVTKKKVYVLSEEKENLLNPNLPFEHNYTSKETLTLMRNSMRYSAVETVETTKLVEAVAVMEPEYDRIQQDLDERLTKLEEKMEAMEREHKKDLALIKEELAQTKQDLAQTIEELARLQTEHEQLQLKVFFRQTEDDKEKEKNKADIDALRAEFNTQLKNHRDEIDKFIKLVKDLQQLVQKHTGATIELQTTSGDNEEKVDELPSVQQQ